MGDGPLIIELWLGGKAAERLLAYAKVSGETPEDVLVRLAANLNPEVVRNGHDVHSVPCGVCGIPIEAGRKPRVGEHFYCSVEHRQKGAAIRQAAYRGRRKVGGAA